MTPLWFWDWKPSVEETLMWWGVQLQLDGIKEVIHPRSDDWLEWGRELQRAGSDEYTSIRKEFWLWDNAQHN